jgi:hypothetical protein
MTLKEMMAQDMPVFMNSDEFASTVTLGTNQINAIEATFDDQGIEYEALIVASADVVQASTVTVGSKTYYITAMREDPEDKLLTYIILGAKQ